MSSIVLDASALLAYLVDEPGAEAVTDAIARGAAISAVNLAEVLVRLDPETPAAADTELREAGLLDGAVGVEPFTPADAVEVARLRAPTRAAGLSLADRACLALARRLGVPALTADHAWSAVALPVEVRLIRAG